MSSKSAGQGIVAKLWVPMVLGISAVGLSYWTWVPSPFTSVIIIICTVWIIALIMMGREPRQYENPSWPALSRPSTRTSSFGPGLDHPRVGGHKCPSCQFEALRNDSRGWDLLRIEALRELDELFPDPDDSFQR